MIFVTVGTQMPFDRLIAAVDRWAVCRRDVRVVAQTGAGSYRSEALEAEDFIPPDRFSRLQAEAELIVSHAGMGTILTAGTLCKPLVIMPRRFDLGEHRNDHQTATAARFEGRPGIHVARDENTLHDFLDRRAELSGSSTRPPYASSELLAALGDFISGK